MKGQISPARELKRQFPSSSPVSLLFSTITADSRNSSPAMTIYEVISSLSSKLYGLDLFSGRGSSEFRKSDRLPRPPRIYSKSGASWVGGSVPFTQSQADRHWRGRGYNVGTDSSLPRASSSGEQTQLTALATDCENDSTSTGKTPDTIDSSPAHNTTATPQRRRTFPRSAVEAASSSPQSAFSCNTATSAATQDPSDPFDLSTKPDELTSFPDFDQLRGARPKNTENSNGTGRRSLGGLRGR